MILISEREGQTRIWKDPLVEVHVAEFRNVLARLDALTTARRPAADFLEVAEHLCEMSRDVLFRISRVTERQVNELADVFAQAAERLKSIELADDAIAPQFDEYRRHIESRVDLLRGKLP